MTQALYVRGSSPGAMVVPCTVSARYATYGLILTDPPYGTGKRPRHQYGRRQLRGVKHGDDAFIQNDRDLSELEHCLPFMLNTLHENGIALIFGAPTERLEMELLLAPHFAYVQSIQWDKGQPGMGYGLRWACEDIYICAATDPFAGELRRESLISPLRYAPVREPSHPNQKPVKLLRKLIRWALPREWYADEFEGSRLAQIRPPLLVQDPFAGVASCAVAAICEAVDSISNESDPQWWDYAEYRIKEAQGMLHHEEQQHTLALREEKAEQ